MNRDFVEMLSALRDAAADHVSPRSSDGAGPVTRLVRQDGFTLIEIIVVVIILGLLVGLVGPQIVGRVGESKVETARAQVEMLTAALDLYRLDNGTYPTTEQGLSALWQKLAADLGLEAAGGCRRARRGWRTPCRLPCRPGHFRHPGGHEPLTQPLRQAAPAQRRPLAQGCRAAAEEGGTVEQYDQAIPLRH